MHLQLDAIGGIAGDMFIAACLDAWPELSEATFEAIRASGLPAACALGIVEHRDAVLCGRRFKVGEPASTEHTDHVAWQDIHRRLRESPLEAGVRDRAVAIFEILAAAEGEVHGIATQDVEFHEVGAWDSIADVVGAAYLLEALRPSTWAVGPIPLGGGRTSTAHGALPVPAPATALLLRGFEFIDDGISGERVTPTGAAILKHLRGSLGEPLRGGVRPITLRRCGTGFGTRTLPGLSNVLRVLGFEDAADGTAHDPVAVVEFEVDDQTPEDLALGIDALRDHAGVLDVLQIPATGKKGRLIAHVQVLCRHEMLPEVVDACFLETTTLGLRWRLSARATLARELLTFDTGDRAVGVKVARRPGQRVTAKAEADDLAREAGRAGRASRRRAAEAHALRQHGRGKE